MTEPILYRWPEPARFGRAVPKTKFYEHGNVRSALREKFVDEVQRITWAYKLADATIHLRGTAAVPEIQVFVDRAKGDDVTDDVLTAIDKAVHVPDHLRGHREAPRAQQTRMVAAHKAARRRRRRRSAPTSPPPGSPAGARDVHCQRRSTCPACTRELLAPLLPVAPAGRAARRCHRRVERGPQARTRDRRAGEEAPNRAAAQPQGRTAPAAIEHEERLAALTDPPAQRREPRQGKPVDKLKMHSPDLTQREHRQDRRAVPERRHREPRRRRQPGARGRLRPAPPGASDHVVEGPRSATSSTGPASVLPYSRRTRRSPRPCAPFARSRSTSTRRRTYSSRATTSTPSSCSRSRTSARSSSSTSTRHTTLATTSSTRTSLQ